MQNRIGSAFLTPTASDVVLGGIKVGARLTITNGVLSADVQTGTGDVFGPATNSADYLPQWDGVNSKTLKNGVAIPTGGLAGLTSPVFTTPNIGTATGSASLNLLLTGGTLTGNLTISNTAPSLVLTDTTASAKSLTILADANIVDFRESAGASGSLLVLDLANNRVGIGTATPLSTLHIAVGADETGINIFKNSAPSNLRMWQIGPAEDATDVNLNFRAVNDAGAIQRTVMSMDFSTGNVGFGTTNPLSTLEVAASKTIDFNSSPVTDLTLGSNMAGNGKVITALNGIQFQRNNTNVYADGADGSIRFTGSTAMGPGGLMFLYGSTHATTPGAIQFYSSNFADTDSTTRLFLYKGDSANIADVVFSNSRVGIGATPGTLLDVVGEVGTSGVLRVQRTNASDYEIARFEATAASQDANISFKTQAGVYVSMGIDVSDSNKFKMTTDNLLAAGTVLLTITTGGNMGVGISPTAVLHLKAGTATASTAPLKLTSGTLNTTAEAGAIEFLTDAYYATITTGAARKTFAFLESPSFTTPTIGGVAIPSISSTNTLTNKRVTKRAPTVTQSATPTINTDNTDVAHITGLAQAITSMTTNLSGTPVEGDLLRIDFTDDGTGRAITWGASFEASTVALPTTTVASTRLDVGFIWNAVTSKWRCVASV